MSDESEPKTRESIGADVLTTLASKFTPEVIRDKIEELIDATIFDKQGNEVMDIRGREAGLKLLKDLLVGPQRPVEPAKPQRRESAEANLGRILQSPAARKALKEAISLAEKGD